MYHVRWRSCVIVEIFHNLHDCCSPGTYLGEKWRKRSRDVGKKISRNGLKSKDWLSFPAFPSKNLFGNVETWRAEKFLFFWFLLLDLFCRENHCVFSIPDMGSANLAQVASLITQWRFSLIVLQHHQLLMLLQFSVYWVHHQEPVHWTWLQKGLLKQFQQSPGDCHSQKRERCRLVIITLTGRGDIYPPITSQHHHFLSFWESITVACKFFSIGGDVQNPVKISIYSSENAFQSTKLTYLYFHFGAMYKSADVGTNWWIQLLIIQQPSAPIFLFVN